MPNNQNKRPDYYRRTIQKAIDDMNFCPGVGAGPGCSNRKAAAPATGGRNQKAAVQEALTERPSAGAPMHRPPHTPCGLVVEGEHENLEDTKVSPCPERQGEDLGCLHPSYKDTSIHIGGAVYDTDVTSTPDFQEGAKPLKTPGNTLQQGDIDSNQVSQSQYIITNSPVNPSSTRMTKKRQLSVMDRVREYARAAEREFSSDMIMTHFDKLGVFVTLEQRKNLATNVNQILSRLAKKKEIKKVRQGVYRRPTSESDAPRIDFLNASTDPFEVRWPLTLEKIVRLYPKNLVVVGGSPNSGKTAFLLNFARLNMDSHTIRYLSSEMGPEELRVRLEGFQRQFGISLQTWANRVDFRECSCDCLDKRSMEILLDLIEPDGITIIDYLEIHRDFHVIAEPLRKMFDRLNQGVVLIGLQKDPEAPFPRGKSFGLEKPRLAVSLDYDKSSRMHHLSIIKAKARVRGDIKPEDVDFWFDIEEGAKLLLKEKKYQGGNWPA
jgi:hypothetical protein